MPETSFPNLPMLQTSPVHEIPFAPTTAAEDERGDPGPLVEPSDPPDGSAGGGAPSTAPSSEDETVERTEVAEGPPDVPEVASLSKRTESTCDEDKASIDNYSAMGKLLAASGDIYRNSTYGGGLILGSDHPNVTPTPIVDPAQLLAIIVDRIIVKLVKDGKSKGGIIPAVHLRTMLRSEAFLGRSTRSSITRPTSGPITA